MKIKKTTYNPNENLTRSKLSNPHSKVCLNNRLVEANAIDLENNSTWVDLGNGFSKVIIDNKNKTLKDK